MLYSCRYVHRKRIYRVTNQSSSLSRRIHVARTKKTAARAANRHCVRSVLRYIYSRQAADMAADMAAYIISVNHLDSIFHHPTISWDSIFFFISWFHDRVIIIIITRRPDSLYRSASFLVQCSAEIPSLLSRVFGDVFYILMLCSRPCVCSICFSE